MDFKNLDDRNAVTIAIAAIVMHARISSGQPLTDTTLRHSFNIAEDFVKEAEKRYEE